MKKELYRVIGDHPVMARPDKVFCGEMADIRAKCYAGVLRDQGYENVATIRKVEQV